MLLFFSYYNNLLFLTRRRVERIMESFQYPVLCSYTYYIEKNDLWGPCGLRVKERVNCSWKTSQKVKDTKRNEKSEKRGCQTCRDVVLYLSAKRWDKRMTSQSSAGSPWKEPIDAEKFRLIPRNLKCSKFGKVQKLLENKAWQKITSVVKWSSRQPLRLRRTGPWKLNNIEKLVTEPIFVLEKHVKQFQTK